MLIVDCENCETKQFQIDRRPVSNSKHSEIANLREGVISTLELVQRVVLLPSIDQPRSEELINSRISQGSGSLVEIEI